jgi:hypothetical protein
MARRVKRKPGHVAREESNGGCLFFFLALVVAGAILGAVFFNLD